ncbi:transcriptional regulator, TetR family [Amycolatopsis marina]|uniref:Transcriptional regulator, TetR family n=1 Tax=Amycolatopsis marina TaxID=490629 RepID=A0A1I0VJU3_9PSEU|nr:TetR/AcrR family transcriptional regulator [Amycolatopsis marina]SFA76664.1 transcriptional regulator, TetR family [Amycolatopsis marina]
MPKPSSRDRILDAYENVLIAHGPAGVTLEGVAAEAGVSKGGLLYHFGSKDALLDGLLDRVRRLNDADIEQARKAPKGVVHYYLRSSVSDVTKDEALHRATLATIRLAGNEPRVDTAMRSIMEAWRELLAEHVSDPLTAELIAAIGDALYLRAAFGDTSDAIVRNLDEVLDRLGT